MKVNTSLNADLKNEFEVLLKMVSFLGAFPSFLALQPWVSRSLRYTTHTIPESEGK